MSMKDPKTAWSQAQPTTPLTAVFPYFGEPWCRMEPM
jgi:hypothetical protein